MKKIKYLILGAGVSGLSFANNINDSDYLIIEKNIEAGGYCKTNRTENFVWDYAGHFFHFSHPELKKKFEKILSSNEIVTRKKETKIYYKGYYVDYPFQKNIHQLTKDEMIDCLFDLFFKAEKDHYDSFLDMLYGKFGKSITEKFLRPYNEKLYACDLDCLDVNAMGRFFPYADVNDIIKNMKYNDNSSYNQTFLYPKRGAEVFVEKLLDGIIENNIHFDEAVIKVDTEHKLVETDKDTYVYDYLINSIPMNRFASMTDFSIDRSVFSYNQVLVFNLGFDLPAVDPNIHWIYVPSKDINFYRVGFYNNIIGTKALSIYVEIGYPKQSVIDKFEIEKQLNLTINNLQRMGIINSHKIIDYETIEMNPAYVHITKKGNEVINQWKQKLKQRNVYMVGRYGDWKYCSIEDCMLDSINVIKSIRGN